MKTKTILSLILIIFYFNANSQINYSVNFNVENLQILTDTVLGNIYNVLEFENLPYISDTGKPYLPIKTLHFIIPANRDVNSITINTSTYEVIYNVTHF